MLGKYYFSLSRMRFVGGFISRISAYNKGMQGECRAWLSPTLQGFCEVHLLQTNLVPNQPRAEGRVSGSPWWVDGGIHGASLS